MPSEQAILVAVRLTPSVISRVRGIVPEGGVAPSWAVSLFVVIVGECLGKDIAEKQ